MTHVLAGSYLLSAFVLHVLLTVGEAQQQLPTPVTLHRQANAAYDRGDYQQARQLWHEALAGYRARADHRGESAVLNNLGVLYHRLHQYSTALAYYQQALTLQERVLGREHPDLVPTLEHYAVLLQKMQRHAEADAMQEWARHIRSRNPPGRSTQ